MTTRSNRSNRLHPAGAVLWASAFVVSALAIMQAGRLAPNPAYADAVSTDDGFSLLTTPSGLGGGDRPYDLLYVIDSTDETMFIYWIENATNPTSSRLTLMDGAYLPALFNAAR